MFEVNIDKASAKIFGTNYLPSQSGWKVTGTMDDAHVQRTNMSIPRPFINKDKADFVLCVLDKDGKSLMPLPCKPIPLYDQDGCVIPPKSLWVVLSHPTGKVWAYREDDPRFVMFKNSNTGNCFVLNQLTTDPAAKKVSKIKDGYEILPGFYTFSGSDHRFISLT